MILKDSPRLSDLGTDRFLGNLSMRRAKRKVLPGPKHSKARIHHPRTAAHSSEASHRRVARSTRHSDNAGMFQPTPGQCNRCGEVNHAAKFCKHKDKVTRHTCGEKGHKSKHHLPQDPGQESPAALLERRSSPKITAGTHVPEITELFSIPTVITNRSGGYTVNPPWSALGATRRYWGAEGNGTCPRS